jgi:hypothetical protein
MNNDSLKKFQYATVERVYKLVDELAEVTMSVDIDYVSKETNRIAKAISAEVEGMEEAVKEYHGI